MYRGLSVIAIAPAYNEERKIGDVVRRTSRPLVDDMLVIDDGSPTGRQRWLVSSAHGYFP